MGKTRLNFSTWVLGFFIVLAMSCTRRKNIDPCAPSFWEATDGQTLKISCHKLTYINATSLCELEGEYVDLDPSAPGTDIEWHLPRTCSADTPSVEAGYIAISKEHTNFSMPGLGINSAFYKVDGPVK
jgi:hypothetical protein